MLHPQVKGYEFLLESQPQLTLFTAQSSRGSGEALFGSLRRTLAATGEREEAGGEGPLRLAIRGKA